jgi:DNA-directed RNA polymerase subunit RPC12/RpoP
MNNLITCRICGSLLTLPKKISENDVIHCPYCHNNIINPLKYEQMVQESEKKFNQGCPKGCLKICLISIAISGVLSIIGYISGDYDTTTAVHNSAFDASVHQVEQYLKRTLKDPESYKGMEWSAVQEVSAGRNYRYYVRHKYRAKNSYGGYVVEEKVFYLDDNGNVVRTQNY